MADPVTLGLILGGTGLLKSETLDKDKANRQRNLKATQERYSGWTGRAPTQQVQEADPFGSALTYGTQGAAFGQGLQKSQAETDLLNKMNKNEGPWGSSVNLGSSPSAPNYFGGDYSYEPWKRSSLGGGFT